MTSQHPVVLRRVLIQRSLSAKYTDALRMRTDEFLHATVDDEQVVDEMVVLPAVCPANGTDGFAGVELQMCQQVKPEDVRVDLEGLKAEAAALHRRTGGCRRRLTLHAREVGFVP